MITISERVQVPHSPDLVWSVLSDPKRVVGCIEGSELGEYHEDGSFDARLAVKFAAIKVAFAARASLDLDEAARVGRLEAQGADARGSTRVKGHATFEVRPDGTGSVVDLDGNVDITGQLASLVTTGAAVVVARMTRSFAAELTATCDELAGVKPVTASGPTLGQRLLAAVRACGAWFRHLVARRDRSAIGRG
ncbi:SRPBCC domain-containing protein [Nocardioides cheoyonin]|uniref:SRPBCC domain-containing protein n=1 Tax=Nocardioides cheoyonin TaxID=3156615 RepID=UPI0032B5A85F